MSLRERLEKQRTPEIAENIYTTRQKDPYSQLKNNLRKKIIEELKDLPPGKENTVEELAPRIETIVFEMLDSEGDYIPRQERQRIASEIIDDTIGFGPITPLLSDSEINEIMINGPNQVYVEKKGLIEQVDVKFRNNAHVMHVIEKIVAPIGRHIDEAMPMVDARLPDGSRVNAIIPPLVLNGPTVTIRKFFRDLLTMEELIKLNTLTPQMAEFLEACVKGRLNIIVSGGTGSGKTTTLNVLSSFIPDNERIITIEDAAELQLRQKHVLSLESRPPNIEGKGSITIRDLVRNALRMRPDRIVVGEVRSGEALDMLQAMNTGHDGSLTTGHANTPRDMLSRLETMVMMAGMELPIKAIRDQISSAIDLIIHQNRLRDGSRKITHVTEIQGMEGDVIVLQDVYLFKQTGVNSDNTIKGGFSATGIRPKCIEKLEAFGISLPKETFEPAPI